MTSAKHVALAMLLTPCLMGLVRHGSGILSEVRRGLAHGYIAEQRGTLASEGGSDQHTVVGWQYPVASCR
jgi:hypothetical protein